MFEEEVVVEVAQHSYYCQPGACGCNLWAVCQYGVATISRLLKITGLFYRISSLL